MPLWLRTDGSEVSLVAALRTVQFNSQRLRRLLPDAPLQRPKIDATLVDVVYRKLQDLLKVYYLLHPVLLHH
jgi:hypothetical protein